MPVANASRTGPTMSSDEAQDLIEARERMLARHKLIEGMIRNNEQQMRNESARGGAEIEREAALRDEKAGTAGAAVVEAIDARLRTLNTDHQRLVSEREWLNAALLDYERDPSAQRHTQAGHA